MSAGEKTMNRTHGMCKTSEYEAWKGMRQRCKNKTSSDYDYYGGRGIGICSAWDKFENFYAYLGAKPSSAHTLDRIDNDGDYEPGNVRWTTRREQTLNRRAYINNQTKYRGVNITTSTKGAKRFHARVTSYGVVIYLGTCNTLEEAAHIYDQFARVLHGKHAKLNYQGLQEL